MSSHRKVALTRQIGVYRESSRPRFGSARILTSQLELIPRAATNWATQALVAAAGAILSHSARSAITGSILVARRAGNHDAHSVTNSRKTDSAR